MVVSAMSSYMVERPTSIVTERAHDDGPFKVVITGSRNWTDAEPIRRRLAQLPAGSIVMHGDAPGADRLAARIARDLGHTVVPFPADWSVRPDTPKWAIRRRADGSLYDVRAGQRRNVVLIDQEPHLVLAWWDGKSRGTRNCIELAIGRGIPTEVA